MNFSKLFMPFFLLLFSFSTNLSFGLSSSDSEDFAPKIMGFSGGANDQRPFASTKSTGNASKVPEGEGEKSKTQVTNVQVVNLSRIPKEDKERIAKLLSYLVLDEGFAYTLFGSKPMSVVGHDKNTPLSYQELYQHPLFELESWWQTWEKYSHLFPMKEFFLFSQNKAGWFEVFLINKHRALSIIEDNLPLFRNKMGKNFEPIEILEYMTSRNVYDELNNSHALLGILLGYGRENAVGFENYFSKSRKSHLSLPKNSAEIVPIEMEEIAVPCFASFSNKETVRIVKKYNRERDRIVKIYSKGNFLETTLSRLMSHQE